MLKRMCLSSAVLFTVLSVCQTSHAQMFFDADWLYYGRDNGSSRDVVTGPNGMSLSDGNFGDSSGYRLTIGGGIGELEIDGSFLQLDTWDRSSAGTFGSDFITLDGQAIPGDPGQFNSFAPLTALFQAATVGPIAGPDDELTESERLRSFSDPMFGDVPLTFGTFNRSNYREFEINLGTRRNANWWRFSVGYRHIKLDERSGLTLGGVFDAFDVDDGSPFTGLIGDDPNNGLSHASLISTGLVNIGGASDGYNAFFVTLDPMMAIAPDLMVYQILGNANNELNGAQITGSVRIFDGEWVTIEGIGKAGIYRNRATGQVQETVAGAGNDDSVYRRTFTGDKVGAAFAGNLGIRGTFSLTDYINLIAGYDVLFLSGVALGSEQTDGLQTDILGNTQYSVRNNGSMIAYGSTLGLEILW